jgi:hypothetical protein
MSDVSLHRKLGAPRRLRDAERSIICKMLKGTSFEKEIVPIVTEARVRDMADGGMGSIRFHKKAALEAAFGEQIAEGAFRDADGVPVSVTLAVDKTGNLFELDVFKADGSPLVRYPDADDFTVIERHEKLGYVPR